MLVIFALRSFELLHEILIGYEFLVESQRHLLVETEAAQFAVKFDGREIFDDDLVLDDPNLGLEELLPGHFSPLLSPRLLTHELVEVLQRLVPLTARLNGGDLGGFASVGDLVKRQFLSTDDAGTGLR